MPEPKATVIGHIAPGPQGTKIVISESHGLTISITGIPTPPPADKPDDTPT